MKTILVATVSAVALSGCAWLQSLGEKIGIAGTPADARIYITSDGAPTCERRTFDVQVVPDRLVFKLSEHPSAFTIHWRVSTIGYSFPPGTKVTDPTPPGEIHGCTAGGQAMNCINNSKTRGKWKYTVPALKDKDGCTVPPKDPIISNE